MRAYCKAPAHKLDIIWSNGVVVGPVNSLNGLLPQTHLMSGYSLTFLECSAILAFHPSPDSSPCVALQQHCRCAIALGTPSSLLECWNMNTPPALVLPGCEELCQPGLHTEMLMVGRPTQVYTVRWTCLGDRTHPSAGPSLVVNGSI